MKEYSYLLVTVLLSVFLTCGCSQYGKLRPQSSEGHSVTIEDLESNWLDYDIYYAEASPGRPTAIMFDPNYDDKTLNSDKWIEVENQVQLSRVIRSIQGASDFSSLDRILGPGGQFFGYMFYGKIYPMKVVHFIMKALDAKTLWVYDVQVSDSAGPGADP
jgi:hypothetical protein